MYKVVEYRDVITSKDADTQKRYSMIEKLSRDFTIENKIALEMDRLLVEQLQLEHDLPASSATKSIAEKKTAKKSAKDVDEIFQELFDALKKHQGHPINEEAVRELVQTELDDIRLGFQNLNDEVKKVLSSQQQIIRYELPAAVTTSFRRPTIPTFQQIVDDVVLGNNVMLVGGAGTGKTYLAEHLISKIALGRQHITINCSQWTSPTEIIGGQTMDGYVEGKLIEAWTNGYVLILDELPKIDPNTAGLFNDALAKTKIHNAVIFNARKESFTKHEHFACIATGNIYPDKESVIYGANNKQDLSLLDRFAGSVYFIEKNPTIEREILQNDLVWSISDRMRTAIEELKYEAQVSLRFMQNARDSYNLEMQRLKTKAKGGVEASDGKTFKSTLDSYISTFTEIQQSNIKGKIRYTDLFSNYEYREFDKDKNAY
ncbi:AAA family ATPase [Fulvivirgaceae bacterium PWU4]|uniref:AAA family ATPase n=1 Tax=Chryseosolibacter histidini TaxID=2782349 RepID=A0AAP2DHX6_9BACT|nr:AAA family ATPase [Chryseosolibacter histidini]MBT1695914.1 AAA family ATPase [Chryseosolibacter histidini]